MEALKTFAYLGSALKLYHRDITDLAKGDIAAVAKRTLKF
jgi:hypothetical protein